jgi:undecaprenyl-diphosphatase
LTFLEAILLGLLQGLTEFLPVSSSGHLVLGEQLLGLVRRDDVTFEVFVHFGTFLSVVVVFWNDIVAIVRSVWKAATTMNVSPKQFREDERFRLGVCIAVASIPAGVVGLLYEDEIAKAW